MNLAQELSLLASQDESSYKYPFPCPVGNDWGNCCRTGKNKSSIILLLLGSCMIAFDGD
jgi:hypothetical protein